MSESKSKPVTKNKTEMKKSRPAKTGLAMGRNRGFIVQKRDQYVRPSNRKGRHYGKRVQIVHSLIRELCGFAPYEKRIMELMKSGGANAQKKCLKFAKKRLGTSKRAKNKQQEITMLVSKGMH